MTEQKFNEQQLNEAQRGTAPGTMQVKMPGRMRVAGWLLASFGVFAVLYTGTWFFLSHQLNTGIEAWIEQQRKSGVRVRYADRQRSGFPWAVKLIFGQPAITSDRQPAPFAWQGQRAIVTLKPWQPWRVHVALGGPQQISVVERGQGKNKTTTWQGHAQKLSADVYVGSSSHAQLKMRFRKIDMRTTGLKTKSGAQRLQLERGNIGLNQYRKTNASEKTPSLIVSADITGLRVPKSLPLLLGHDFSKVAFEASVLGPMPKILKSRPLMAWRDAGGTVEIERAEVIHGPLNLKTSGTMALDGNLQLVGAFSAQIQGIFDVINVLRDRGAIKPKVALTARFVLGALSKRPSTGGRPRLDVALSIQNQKVYVGPLAIMKLPTIHWDGLPERPKGTP